MMRRALHRSVERVNPWRRTVADTFKQDYQRSCPDYNSVRGLDIREQPPHPEWDLDAGAEQDRLCWTGRRSNRHRDDRRSPPQDRHLSQFHIRWCGQGTPESVRIDCIDATPSPKPGTGASRAPCRTANRNVVRGVCIIRKASRFCLEKKLDEVLLSPARTVPRPPWFIMPHPQGVFGRDRHDSSWQRHSARIIRTPIGTLVQWGGSDVGILL
jgi:hypothetical protein